VNLLLLGDGLAELLFGHTRGSFDAQVPRSLVELPLGVAEDVDPAEGLSLTTSGGRAASRGLGA
jgi:hypothetical protein